MKKLLSLILVVTLLFAFAVSAYAGGPGGWSALIKRVEVFVDDKKVEFDVQPEIINGRTMVPLRAIFEALGATVEWKSISESAIAVRNSTTIVVAKNSDVMTVNGRKITLDCPVCILDGRTMVPVRAISEAFGLAVEWIDETRTVLIKSAGSISVGTNASCEPFSFERDGYVVGIDIEVAAEIAMKLGQELNVQNMEFEQLLGAINTNQVEFVVSGMMATDERRQEVDFSDPYYIATQAILVPLGSGVDDANDIKTKKVGVVKGSRGQEACKELGFEKVTVYSGAPAAIQDIKKGWLDAIVLDQQVAEMLVEANRGYPNGNFKVIVDNVAFEKEEYCIPVKKGNTELLNVINQTIAELKSKGKINEIVGKYKY